MALIHLGTLVVVSNTDGTILAQAMSPEALDRCTARDHVSSELAHQSDNCHLPRVRVMCKQQPEAEDTLGEHI